MFIKLGHHSVRGAHLKVDLDTAQALEPCLCLTHEGSPNMLPPMRFENCDPIEPASVPIVTSHDGTDYTVRLHCNDQQVRLEGEFRRNSARGNIPRLIVGERFLPERGDTIEVLIAISDNLDAHALDDQSPSVETYQKRAPCWRALPPVKVTGTGVLCTFSACDLGWRRR